MNSEGALNPPMLWKHEEEGLFTPQTGSAFKGFLAVGKRSAHSREATSV